MNKVLKILMDLAGINYQTQRCICVSTFSAVASGYPFYLTDYVVDPATVGEYTGLLDKNGVEICEGDIVRDRWGVHEVFWDEYRFGLKGFWCTCYDSPYDGFSECVDQLEIIGNIHDSPELLTPPTHLV